MSQTQDIGFFKDVSIRDIFPNENDFSDWIFKKENLDLFAEQLNLPEINPVERESYVGTYRLDILAEETDSPENKIIIENMFGTSNHDHLGKLLTYLAGKTGINSHVTNAIWIVETARDEHRDAIKLLNERFAGTNFYLVEVAFKKIGESLPAPFFDVVERPLVFNETSRKTRSARSSDGTKTESRVNLFSNIWNGFCEFAFNEDENDLSEICPNFLKKTQRDRNYLYVSASKYFHVPIYLGFKVRQNDDSLFFSFDFPEDKMEQIKAIDFSDIAKKYDFESSGIVSPGENGNKPHVSFIKCGVGLTDEANWPKIFKLCTDTVKLTAMKLKEAFNV